MGDIYFLTVNLSNRKQQRREMCLDSGRAEMYIGRHTFSNGSNRLCAATEGTDTDESSISAMAKWWKETNRVREGEREGNRLQTWHISLNELQLIPHTCVKRNCLGKKHQSNYGGNQQVTN
jgi:hypothetical protein